MTSIGAPAKPWYDLVIETLALRGMTKAELTDRSGVAKSTIDKWERNPGKPQARSVTKVADALGIPRERAVRLAGIIPPPPARGLSERTQRLMREEVGDEMTAALIAHAEHLASGRIPPAGDAGPRGSSGRDRRSAG